MIIERLNPAQTLIASGEENGGLSVRQALNDTTTWRIPEAHSSAILALDWSPDGIFLASSSQDGIVHVWDARTGTARGTCSYPTAIRQLHWSPDGCSIALALSNQPPSVWHVFALASSSS